jgi:hypothetical protein
MSLFLLGILIPIPESLSGKGGIGIGLKSVCSRALKRIQVEPASLAKVDKDEHEAESNARKGISGQQ